MKCIIDEACCKGCGLCVSACKPAAISLGARRNAKGYHVPDLDDAACVACGNCEWTCPEMAITVTRPERPRRNGNAQ